MSDTTTTPAPTEETAPEQPQTARASTDTPKPDTEMGDQGKRALTAERQARRAAEKAANEALAKVKEYEDRDKSESERLTEQLAKLKAEADQARAEALRLRVASEAGLPADLQEFLVGDDEDTLRARAQKLMAATATADPRRGPAPDPSQGAKPTAGNDGQLTRADLARMTPEQIRAAQDAGRFNDLLAGRTG